MLLNNVLLYIEEIVVWRTERKNCEGLDGASLTNFFTYCSNPSLSCISNRMKNPHLRAKLAEVLEAVMPHMEPVAPGAAQPIVYQRERVFCSYRHAPQLAEALITVFVDIEFTGETDIFQSGETVKRSETLCVNTCVYSAEQDKERSWMK